MPNDRLSSGGTTYALTQYSYDNANNLTCAASRLNAGAFGSLPSSACTLGTAGSYGDDRITAYEYNAVDQVTRVKSAYGTALQQDTVTTTYATNAKPESVADAKGNLTTYEYDGFHRLAKTRYPNATGGGSSTTDYTAQAYDAASQVTTMTLRDGNTVSIGYDNLGRITSRGGSTVPVRTFAYDNLSRNLSVTLTGSSQAVTFAWDALSRMTSTTAPQGTLAYTYDLAGKRTRMTWPDSFYVDYDYLLTGEVTAIRENGATSGVGVLASFAYDNIGRRTGLTRGNGVATSYGFDAVSRLTSLADDLPGGTTYDNATSLTWTPAAQIATRTRSNTAYAFASPASASTAYTANGLNQYSAVGSITPTYDSRGNLTSAGSTTYAYDGDNLLTTATGGHTFAYDPLNRLYQTSTSTSVNARFFYDGVDLIGEYDGSNSLLRRYVHGPGDDEPMVWYEGSGTSDRRFLAADERGSVTTVTNGSGALSTLNSYDEWGNRGTGNAGRFQYTGQTWLDEAGLYYYKARLYSPSLARFLQTDPIGYQAGMNLYAYVGNDPVGRTDPLGLYERTPGVECRGNTIESHYDSQTNTLYCMLMSEERSADANAIVVQARRPRRKALGLGLGLQLQQDICAAPGPRDILNAAIRTAEARRASDNRQIDEVNRRFGVREAKPIVMGIYMSQLNWFINMVHDRGEWDFKYKKGTMGNQDFGNFAFGATAQALGLGGISELGADIYSLWKKGVPEDQDAQARAGKAYYNNGCTK